MTFRIAWLVVAAALCLPGTSRAQVPPLISYQGTLVENAFPASGTFTIAFRFYDTPTDGTPLAGWEETRSDVPVSDGHLRALLGSETPLPEDLFAGREAVYLEVEVDGETLPRLRVASTAYALHAGTADRVTNGGVTTDALAVNAVTASRLATGAVTTRAIGDAAVTESTLASDAVTNRVLAPQSVTGTKIADGTITSVDLGPASIAGDALADGAITTRKIANSAVTADKVGVGQVLKSLNALTDDVRILGGANVNIATNSGDGTITISATPTSLSSQRWKSNVRPIADPIDQVRALRGVRYTWTERGEEHVGLIAEDVGRVVPEVVTYEENGIDARSVDYGRLVAVLIEAVKAQQAQLTAERAAIEDLRARVEALEAALQAR
jgi:hypothetical protein